LSKLSYSDVPKTHKGQLLWRYFMVMQTHDKRRRKAIENACRRSVLFHINTFIWINEPRKHPNCVPFNTYEYQDDMISTFVDNVRKAATTEFDDEIYDMLVEKSRTMGVTWAALAPIDWFWRFHPRSMFLLISKKEDDVDKRGDMRALMSKLDYIEEHMPNAFRVRGRMHNQHHGRSHLLIYNLYNNASITGESANANAGRSGRYLGVLRDEEAFAEHGDKITAACTETTLVQLRVSTPNGTANSFYRARKDNLVKVFSFHWSIHPLYSKGLYEYKDGVVNIKDQKWHDDYHKEREKYYVCQHEPTCADPGTAWQWKRSPWFDQRCKRYGTNPKDISQELQISYHGTGSPYFQIHKLTKVRERHAVDPVWQGELADIIPVDIIDGDARENRCKAWVDILGGSAPQTTTYTMGCDIGTGTGSSDTAITVVDDSSRRKVFEFFSNGILPEEFAEKVVAPIYKAFVTALGVPFISWDQGGPGIPFGAKILSLGSMQVYYYRHRDQRGSKVERRPGLPAGGNCKSIAFERFRTALFGGYYITPSKETYLQATEYVYPDASAGAPYHVASKETNESSGRGEQHGDVLVSEVVACIALEERPAPQPLKQKVRPGSLAWRQAQRKNAEALQSSSSVEW